MLACLSIDSLIDVTGLLIVASVFIMQSSDEPPINLQFEYWAHCAVALMPNFEHSA